MRYESNETKIKNILNSKKEGEKWISADGSDFRDNTDTRVINEDIIN